MAAFDTDQGLGYFTVCNPIVSASICKYVLPDLWYLAGKYLSSSIYYLLQYLLNTGGSIKDDRNSMIG